MSNFRKFILFKKKKQLQLQLYYRDNSTVLCIFISRIHRKLMKNSMLITQYPHQDCHQIHFDAS